MRFVVAPGLELALPSTHLPPCCGRGLHGRVEFGQVPGDLGHKPLETLAVKGAAELLLGGDVPSGEVAVLGPALVDVLGVLVHPHFGHALQVLEGDRQVQGSGTPRGRGLGVGCKGFWRLRLLFLFFS